MTTQAIIEGQGFFLCGELLGIVDKQPYTDKNGQEVVPASVKVLVHDSVAQVEYTSRAQAEAAVAGSAEREPVALAVWASGPWDPETRRRGRVYLQGRKVES